MFVICLLTSITFFLYLHIFYVFYYYYYYFCVIYITVEKTLMSVSQTLEEEFLRL